MAEAANAAFTIEDMDPRDPAAALLIARLSAELGRMYDTDGSGHFVPEEWMRLGGTFLVGRLDGRPIACGAIRPLEPAIAEVKRMYVEPDVRGRGFGRRLLATLEDRARRAGFTIARLETGTLQSEALRLYEAAGYHRIERNSTDRDNVHHVCLEKSLRPKA